MKRFQSFTCKKLKKSTCVIVAAAVLFVLSVSCSEDNPSKPNQNSIDNNMAFEYQNEEPITMGSNYAICCGIWDPGYIDKNAIKIFFYDPSFQRSFWKLFVVPGEVTIDSTYTLPLDYSPILMFLVDVKTSNELSSNEPESSGTITFSVLDCGPPVTISVTIDALLDSEFGGMPPVQVTGSFSCTVYTNPSPYGCSFGI